jgi:hypothetical protein
MLPITAWPPSLTCTCLTRTCCEPPHAQRGPAHGSYPLFAPLCPCSSRPRSRADQGMGRGASFPGGLLALQHEPTGVHDAMNWRPRPCGSSKARTGSAMAFALMRRLLGPWRYSGSLAWHVIDTPDTNGLGKWANGPQIDHRNPVNGCERTCPNATKNVDSN